MRTSLTLITTVTAALAAGLMTAGPAAAHGGDTLLRSGFEGNVPADRPGATPTIAGVPSAGRPWVLEDNSQVRVREDGRIDVKLRGLVIEEAPFNGTNPVAQVAATLVCDDMVADSTDPFDLSPEGDGRTRQHIDVPEDCDDPVVLIRGVNAATGALGGYFAFTTDEDHHHD